MFALSFSDLKEQVNEFAHIQLSDISVIKTLGVGGFGRVELVIIIVLIIIVPIHTVTCYPSLFLSSTSNRDGSRL